MIAGILLLLCVAGGAADEPPVVAVGNRVRVIAPEVGREPVIGDVVTVEAGAVVVQDASLGSPRRIAMNPATSIEISGGRSSKAGRGALLGAAGGALPGLLMTFGDYNTDSDTSPAAVAVIGAAGGAAIGAAIGWAIKSEKWLPAKAPQVSAGIAPTRGGFGVSLRVAWGKD